MYSPSQQKKLFPIISNPDLYKLASLTDQTKKFLKSQSRTVKLWLLYLDMVDIEKTFISADIANTGHNNYAKVQEYTFTNTMQKLRNGLGF